MFVFKDDVNPNF